MLTLSRLLAVAVILATPSLGSDHDKLRSHKRHNRQVEIAEKREVYSGTASVNGTLDLAKRDSFSGRGTYFEVGLGACGQYSQDSDLMVALNSAQYGGGYPGPNCFKWITVQANGQTVGGVQILDECPTCDWGGLDMSPGLFQRFADLGVGVLQITWWFDGDGGGNSQPSPSPSPSPTTQWQQPSTTQWTAPSSSTDEWWTHTSSSTDQWWTHTSTSTWQTPSSSTTSSSSASSSSSSSSSASMNATSSANPYINVKQASQSASASINATSGGTAAAEIQANANNLEAINGLVAVYGQLIVVGAGGSPAS